MLVSLDDVLGFDRPMTYSVKGGEFRVRAREGDLSEAGKVMKALAKRVKKPEKPKLPDPPKPAGQSQRDAAELDATQAKKRAQDAVNAAAAERTREKTSQEKRAATIAAQRKSAMRDAAAQNRDARAERRRASVKATKERVLKKSAERAADKAGQINAQLAHCILAVHFKRKKSVRGAWNICRWSLTKHGYMKPPYREDGKVADVKPTQKGSKRAMQHAMEKHPLNGGIKGSPPEKFQKFKNIFREIEPTV